MASISRGDKSDRSRPSLTYNAEKVIGNGSFGVVYQAQVAETGETVAIKKVFQDRRYKNRELHIMKELRHPNIVQLKHAFYTAGDKPDDAYLNVVMDFMSETVYKVVKQYSKLKQSVPMLLVKLYTYQISRGLDYLHALGICHRDIKPQNLLVCGKTHTLKICDFGSAKKLVKGEPNVSYICSRYYRAPELIFGATEYSFAVDTWSMGCVMGELMLGRPLFPGDSSIDQLVEIIKVLGTPTKDQLLAMNPNYTELKFPQVRPSPIARLFKSNPSVTADSLELLTKILRYEPELRIHTSQVMVNDYFSDLKDPSVKLPGSGRPLPDDLYIVADVQRKTICVADSLINAVQ